MEDRAKRRGAAGGERRIDHGDEDARLAYHMQSGSLVGIGIIDMQERSAVLQEFL